MTLMEVTVVVLVLLSLLATLFMGAQVWKRGADRARCIMQICQVQVSLRSFANMNGYVAGDSVAPLTLKSELFGSNKFIQSEPECPSSGSYTFGTNDIPAIGSLYMTCSLGTSSSHAPSDYQDW